MIVDPDRVKHAEGIRDESRGITAEEGEVVQADPYLERVAGSRDNRLQCSPPIRRPERCAACRQAYARQERRPAVHGRREARVPSHVVRVIATIVPEHAHGAIPVDGNGRHQLVSGIAGSAVVDGPGRRPAFSEIGRRRKEDLAVSGPAVGPRDVQTVTVRTARRVDRHHGLIVRVVIRALPVAARNEVADRDVGADSLAAVGGDQRVERHPRRPASLRRLNADEPAVRGDDGVPHDGCLHAAELRPLAGAAKGAAAVA